MKKIVITLIFLFATTLAFAQTPPLITDQRVKSLGRELIIDFNIQLREANQWCALAVYLSVDGGETFKRTPLKAVSGDVDYINYSGNKKIVWKVQEEDISILPGDNLVFKVEVKSTGLINEKVVEERTAVSMPSKPKRVKPRIETSLIVMANMGIMLGSSGADADADDDSEFSYGLGLGYSFGRLGVYAKFRSNFNFQKTDYTASLNNIWTTGESRVQNYVVAGGIIVGLTNWLQIYAGAGYGNRTLAWQDVDKKWVGINENSYKGIAVDAGIIFKMGSFFLSGGITTTKFKYTDMELGLGIIF